MFGSGTNKDTIKKKTKIKRHQGSSSDEGG